MVKKEIFSICGELLDTLVVMHLLRVPGLVIGSREGGAVGVTTLEVPKVFSFCFLVGERRGRK